MAIDSNTRDLIADCVGRIASGDACAAFDLASAFMGHAHEKDIDLNLAVIEALTLLSKGQGCQPAQSFLTGDWSDMQALLRKRWRRAGFIDA